MPPCRRCYPAQQSVSPREPTFHLLGVGCVRHGEEAVRSLLGELRRDLGEVVNRVRFAGERAAVTRHSKTVAAMVSVEDLELLDELEPSADLEALRQARREDDGARIFLEVFLSGQAF